MQITSQNTQDETISSTLDHAVITLRHEGLVAFPTETVYGLGADGLNPRAVERVFHLKGRPKNNPLILHVYDLAQARSLANTWLPEAEKLAEKFWPGPLTIALHKAPHVPSIVTGGGESVAIRCPDHPLTLELLRRFAGPLVGPSANPSGRISPTAAAHVRSYFAPQEVFVLDGGACRAGIESTVISLSQPIPTILRLGIIGVEELSEALGTKVAVMDTSGRIPIADGSIHPRGSPGMLASHYAPQTQTLLVSADAIRQAINAPIPTIAALAHSPIPSIAPHLLISMPKEGNAYAANLYAALMRADAAGVSSILIEEPDMSDEHLVWPAVLDRLMRACAPR